MSLFKMPSRTRVFNFHPRYYDERKEQLKKKVELYSGENKTENRIRSIKFQADLQDNWGKSHYKSQSFKSNIRLIVILVAILALFYYIFMGLDNVGTLIEKTNNV